MHHDHTGTLLALGALAMALCSMWAALAGR